MKPLVIYHANCRDGMCSAAIMYDYLMGECELYAMNYGETLKAPIKNREIIFVDFSLPRRDIILIAVEAYSVLILDHHESAAENLTKLPANVSYVYEPSLSGAGITWNHCYKGIKIPMIVEYVQDRDLWKFEFVATKAVNEALAANYPTMDHWIEDWFALTDNEFIENVLVPQGEGILAAQRVQLDRIKKAATSTVINNTPVIMCNSPILQSELGNELATEFQLPAGIWYLTSDQQVAISWRSLDHLPSALSLAQHFGGGGHRNAAGCAYNPDDTEKFL